MGKALVEPALGALMPDTYFQFERVGFFKQDPESRDGRIIYNRSVTLKHAWNKKVTLSPTEIVDPAGRDFDRLPVCLLKRLASQARAVEASSKSQIMLPPLSRLRRRACAPAMVD